MKRDLDLLRDILLKIENSNRDQKITVTNFLDKGADSSAFITVSGHLQLLLDSGYIEAEQLNFPGLPCSDFVVKRITMNGYDYLDSVRNDKVWNEIKYELKKFAVSVPLDIIKSLGTSIIAKMLGV